MSKIAAQLSNVFKFPDQTAFQPLFPVLPFQLNLHVTDLTSYVHFKSRSREFYDTNKTSSSERRFAKIQFIRKKPVIISSVSYGGFTKQGMCLNLFVFLTNTKNLLQRGRDYGARTFLLVLT